MPRYIAENDVYNLFNARGVAQLHVGDIDVLPRVDVVEVIHGRWIERKEIFCESEGEVDAIGCSKCGKSQRKHHKTNYCPNCGAKMDLEEKRHEIF